jgi:predicted nucleic acid-binding protein
VGRPDRARPGADHHRDPARGRLLCPVKSRPAGRAAAAAGLGDAGGVPHPAIEDRAVEVLTLLAGPGQHRTPSVPDLIIAATAELAGLTVLHCDKDFELIASVTGQPAEWLSTS